MKKFICRIFGHPKFVETRHVAPYISEVQCPRCKAEFSVNARSESIIPLTEEVRKINDRLPSQFVKFQAKKTAEHKEAIDQYNKILGEAKALQVQLELSRNMDRRRAYDRRITEKVNQLNQMAEHMPDVFQRITIL